MTSVTESKIDIVNDTWTLNKLHKILDSIKKPKFQREKKWVVRSSSNNKKANFEEFMKFLIINKNSVTAISLGTYYENNKKYYIAIDGNNRINAVITFLEEPYIIFPYFYDDFFKFVHQIDKDKLTPEMILLNYNKDMELNKCNMSIIMNNKNKCYQINEFI